MVQRPDIDLSQPSGATWGAERMLADLVRETLKEKRRARRWSIFFRLLLVAFVAGFLAYQFWGKALPGLAPVANAGHAATIDVSGPILEGAPANARAINQSLNAAFDDPATRGVVLRINSPGGSAVQSGLVYDEIVRLREEHPTVPVHAVLGDVAASGAYYIAAAADEIHANRASIVGSIGVRLDSFGATEALQKLGLERRLLTAGEHKGLLDPFLPEDPVARDVLQSMLDDVHGQFQQAVRDGRGDRLVENESLFSGLVWSGTQALELGLIDSLDTERTVIESHIGTTEQRDFTQERDVFTRLADQIGARLKTIWPGLESHAELTW